MEGHNAADGRKATKETVRLRNAAFRLFRTRTQAHAGTRTRSVCSRIEYEYEYHFIEYEYEYEYEFWETLSRTVYLAAFGNTSIRAMGGHHAVDGREAAKAWTPT